MSKYFNVNHADQDLTFIINKSGYGKYVRDLEKRIHIAIKYLEGWDANFYAYDTGEDKDNINELLDILKGSDTK